MTPSQHIEAALAVLYARQTPIKKEDLKGEKKNLQAILLDFNQSSRKECDALGSRMSITESIAEGTPIHKGDLVFKVPSSDWQVVDSIQECTLVVKTQDPAATSILFFPPLAYHEPAGRLEFWTSRLFHECHSAFKVLVSKPHSINTDHLPLSMEWTAFRFILKPHQQAEPGKGHYRAYMAMVWHEKVYLCMYSSFDLIHFAKNLATFSAVMAELKSEILEPKVMDMLSEKVQQATLYSAPSDHTKATPELPDFPSLPGESNVKKTLDRLKIKSLPRNENKETDLRSAQVSAILQHYQDTPQIPTDALPISSSDEMASLMSIDNTNLKAIIALITTRQVETRSDPSLLCGHLQFEMPQGWGRLLVPEGIMSSGQVSIVLKPLVSAAASVFVLNPPRSILPGTTMDEFLASFIEIAHAGMTQLTKTVPQIMDSNEIAQGAFIDAEAILQNFVLRQQGRTHYRVYVFVREGQQVQGLVYYTNGMVVFAKHLEVFKKMLLHAKPAKLVIQHVAAQASVPLEVLPSFPCTPSDSHQTATANIPLLDTSIIPPVSTTEQSRLSTGKKFLPFKNKSAVAASQQPMNETSTSSLLTPSTLDQDFFATKVLSDSMEGLYFGEGMGARRLNKETNKMENAWIRVYLLLMHQGKKACIGIPKYGILSQLTPDKFEEWVAGNANQDPLNHGVYHLENDGDKLVIQWLGDDVSSIVGQPFSRRTCASIVDDDTIIFSKKEFSTMSDLKFLRVKPISTVVCKATVSIKKASRENLAQLDNDVNARYKKPIFFEGVYYHQKHPEQYIKLTRDGLIEIQNADISSRFSQPTCQGTWKYCCWHYTMQIVSPMNETHYFTLFVKNDIQEEGDVVENKLNTFILDDVVYISRI